MRNGCLKWGLPKSTDASLRDVNIIPLQIQQTCVLLNDVPVVICGRKMPLANNAGDIKDLFWMYFATYW